MAYGPLASLQSAAAFTGADFDPGNIISDDNFFNPNALGAAQVQAFIDSKVTCAPGAVCLANLHVDTFDIAATPMCSAYQGAAQESAATIIYKVGRACGISQAVILVVLQKEQSLVTATAPSIYALSAAMGAGCYDNGQPCIDQYAGFFNQVFNGAYLLKRYTQPAGTGAGTPYTSRFDLAYPVGQVSNILQSPNCGPVPVFVKNQATHSLYVYTPYTPNASALANLNGIGDTCASYGNRNFWVFYYNWFGNPLTPTAPFGWFDGVTSVGSAVTASGWAIDGSTANPIDVLVSVDGAAGQLFPASNAYANLGTSFPGSGDNHGFAVTVQLPAGDHSICVTAINSGNGATRGIGCKNLTVVASQPIGWLDQVNLVGTQATASGWAIDRGTASAISVKLTVDGSSGQPVSASSPYLGLGNSFPGFGDNHGFSVTSAVPVGVHTVCVTAIALAGGADRQIGCRTLVVAASNMPIGWLDNVAVVGTQATATGWALDRDTASSISVRIAVDGVPGQPQAAANSYPGLGKSFPGFGDNHGFSAVATVPAGTHNVCVVAVNDGVGGDREIGCRTITVLTANQPIGWLDSVSTDYQQTTLSGWTIDRDTAAPISILVSIDGGVGQSFVASNPYAGLGNAYPGFGDNHGFTASVTVPLGQHTVCVTGVNDAAGGNREIACRAVTSTQKPPVGWVDSVSSRGRMVTVSGWTIDLATSAPISVQVSIDGGASQTFPASNPYPNLGLSFPGSGDNHGFSATVFSPVGDHTLCVTAINLNLGTSRQLSCKSFTVAAASTPIGWLDTFTANASTVTAAGWAIDPDTASPILINMTVDGIAAQSVAASTAYANLGNAYPGFGDYHGFSLSTTLTSGTHAVCVIAVNDVPGNDRVLGCSTFAVG